MNKKRISSAVLALLGSACSTLAPESSTQTAKDPARVSYTRLYCTADQEARFERVTAALDKREGVPPAPSAFGRLGAASSMALAGFGPHWGANELESRKFYTPPAVQWVVYLEGGMAVTASNNETRHFRAGDLLRVEDVAPCKGHISVVGDETTFVLIVR